MKFTYFILVAAVFLYEASCYPSEADQNNHEDVGIIGGHQISIENAPYMASLRRYNGTFHWCGASIVHKQFVLTAAHCILPDKDYKIMVGTDNVSGDGELFDIEKITIHEKYNQKTFSYDFCLIKLKTPMTFSSKIGNVTLPEAGKLPVETVFEVTGWGYTGPKIKVVSPKLLQVKVPLVGRQRCKKEYQEHTQYTITPRMICAGNVGHDACQGDSGGPLTIGNVQYGVTSFGATCGGKLPGVYAKVFTVRSWIEEHLLE